MPTRKQAMPLAKLSRKQSQVEIRNFRVFSERTGKKELNDDDMETDLSEYHKGTDGLYYADYIAPNKAETFIGKLVSTEWWHHRGQFALICNFRTEDRRRIALFAFQKHTGFYGPRYGNVNFRTVEKGTLWQCEIQMTRTGRCTWARARQIKK